MLNTINSVKVIAEHTAFVSRFYELVFGKQICNKIAVGQIKNKISVRPAVSDAWKSWKDKNADYVAVKTVFIKNITKVQKGQLLAWYGSGQTTGENAEKKFFIFFFILFYEAVSTGESENGLTFGPDVVFLRH